MQKNPSESQRSTLKLTPDIIRDKRLEAGMSAAKLSSLVGCSTSYISKVESGGLAPSAIVIAKIFRVLNFSDIEIVWFMRIIDL
jgi:transcriptional regulator with XRE-family HTH domain